jgi:hypothetical protein
MPNPISQIGVKQVRIDMTPNGWVVIISGEPYLRTAEIIDRNTSILLDCFDIEEAKLKAVEELRVLIRLALDALNISAKQSAASACHFD